tara:strand:+ start:288 stop:515 length:228 start_codon:yes stop_codon:yes gene_type:complete
MSILTFLSIFSNLQGENLDVEEILLEVYDSKTKLLLGECTIPVAGHKETPLKFAKEHWYVDVTLVVCLFVRMFEE